MKYVSVGWCVVGDDNKPIRKPKKAQWFGQPSPTPAKIYTSKSVASRYGEAREVFIEEEME